MIPYRLFAALCLSTRTVRSSVFQCSTTAEVWDALDAVGPGDEIVLTPGTYDAGDRIGRPGSAAHFAADANGTQAARITLRSEDPSNRAVLRGGDPSKRTVLRVFGDYWTVRDIAATNAQKGIVFDHADYGLISNCEVYGIGYEGIHIRDGSDHCVIEGCHVHDVGIRNPGLGEAIYIGTAVSSWSTFDPHVTHTIVRNNTLGPFVSAEGVDIKEGTEETVLEYNTFDALGLSGCHYADSFVDIKGSRAYVRFNTFVRHGADQLRKGVAIIEPSDEHVVHENVFSLDGVLDIRLVEAPKGSTSIYAWDNARTPNSSDAAGKEYSSSVIPSCCPPWYDKPEGGKLCPAPHNCSYSRLVRTSVTLSWMVGDDTADSFLVRYKEMDAAVWNEIPELANRAVAIEGLEESTIYSWQVAATCNSRVSAAAVGPDFVTQGENRPDLPERPPAKCVPAESSGRQTLAGVTWIAQLCSFIVTVAVFHAAESS